MTPTLSEAKAVSVAEPEVVTVPETDEERETEGLVVSGGILTVSVKVVERVRDPAVPVTVIVEFPVGVVDRVEMVSVEEHPGLHEVGEKEAVAFAGSPEAEKVTG